MKEWFTLNQVSKIEHFPYKNRQTIKNLVISGQIKAMITGKGRGRRYLINIKSVKEYIKKAQKGN